ncbi:MAG: sugar phosphorylase [Limnothrix sp. RL_2_0]|nr:sugar phosphorylase [Limnothrix sp. RL_2_0]
MTTNTSLSLGDRLNYFLPLLYPEHDPKTLLKEIEQAIAPHLNTTTADEELWDETTISMITYGDTLLPPAESHTTPLHVLKEFLQTRLDDIISCVHILPFFPYSSDDGFAVIDYRKVNPSLGSWDDIVDITDQFEMMADLVINHISSESDWFKQFLSGEKPGCDYFITLDPATDCQQVIRPRSSPLLTPVETKDGTKHVWTTFSADQVDVNFANPDVLLEFIDIVLGYCQKGIRFIRLDAVGFLWKRLNTPCIHLPETHFVIQLLREILATTYPRTVIITETNVPNLENLSYFGRGNEAHMIYNFSLPPLLLNALIRGEAKHLKTWMKSMPPAQEGCAYFNFTASHDGIGLRPAEGLVEGDEFGQLVDTMAKFGAKISYRTQSDGSQRPYELNIALFDALKGTIYGEDKWQKQRFVCSQAIMMALEGVPAFYIHSLLATPNDNEKVAATGHNRSINRHQWDYAELSAKLDDPESDQHWVFNEIKRLIGIRRQQQAFHPNATQYTLDFQSPAVFGLWRQSRNRRQSIFCIYNLSDRPKSISVSNLNLICTDEWNDLLGNVVIDENTTKIKLAPYQIAWITNAPVLH